MNYLKKQKLNLRYYEVEKEFKTWLVLNYRTEEFRLNKKKPRKIHPSEIAIDLKIKVKIPKEPIMKARGYIELDTLKVKEMIMDTL